ncbi:hypothetical protein [Salinarchaeum laminariae]|uniref:hypothetical protein n=1 Tax=Salinarchaeum laminariae TaxID=869888 RepID=UPI0020BD4A48|nr:hypothetical protein [Salinarchaeum laminariae]
MNRRSLLQGLAVGSISATAGCLSSIGLGSSDNQAATVTDVGVENAGNLTGYGNLPCDISQAESLATPVSALQFGSGGGEHWIYLILDADEPITVDVDVQLGSSTIYEENVELGEDRYTSYEFTSGATYSIDVSYRGFSSAVAVHEDRIHTPDRPSLSVSGQTCCLDLNGVVHQESWP